MSGVIGNNDKKKLCERAPTVIIIGAFSNNTTAVTEREGVVRNDFGPPTIHIRDDRLKKKKINKKSFCRQHAQPTGNIRILSDTRLQYKHTVVDYTLLARRIPSSSVSRFPSPPAVEWKFSEEKQVTKDCAHEILLYGGETRDGDNCS